MSEFQADRPPTTALHLADYPTDPMSKEGTSTSQHSKKAEVSHGGQMADACPICGDRVSGYHYGLLTCESCKGFFKRTVQNNKLYTCTEHQSCPMDMTQRKRCPYCRFQKCLAVGMKKEAVRADRMRGGRNKFGPLYRRDRQLKQQREASHQPGSAPCRSKLEGTLPHLPATHDFHLLTSPSPTVLPSDPFHQSQLQPSVPGQSECPILLDCSISRDRTLAPPTFPATGLYHSSFQGYAQSKTEFFLGYSQTTPATPSSVAMPPTLLAPPSESCLLAELLDGEPEEAELCTRVLGSLQREQASRGKHDRLNTFSIMCKMADQMLFGLVEWARGCALFKDLKVEDQMCLLQSCWSELLVLDHLHRQVAFGREGSIYLVTGQQIEVPTILSQAGVTLSSLVSRSQDLVSKLRLLQLDKKEFVCLKYLVLFNPDVKSVQDREQVERTQERVNRALMDHTLKTHPSQSDKFGQLLLKLPQVRSLGLQVEEYLYQRHLLGDLPCNSLLTEMLHTKHT